MTTNIYVGISGRVVAIDRATGTELWRTSLRGDDFVNVVLDDDMVLASTRGRLYCLDPATGTIRWENPLKGLGYGIVSIAGAQESRIAPAARKRQKDEEASAAVIAS